MSRTKKHRRLPRAERIASILDVAYDEFARLGYDGVSMTRLATRAGVTKPIVYRYFGSKDGLCAACARRMGVAMMAEVRGATDPSLPSDRQLWAGILAHLKFIEDHRREWRVFVREAPLRGGLAAAALLEGRRAVTRLVAALIREAIDSTGRPLPPAPELEVQAHALLGAIDQVAEWWESHPSQPRELIALQIMNFAWQGFGDLLEGRLWLAPAGSDHRAHQTPIVRE
jgi:AcrR family transcriptional regulator